MMPGAPHDRISPIAVPSARSTPRPEIAYDLPYEPQWPAAASAADDERAADRQGQRIGILIVTYNALATLLPVLKRIPPAVWRNVEEIVIFDDDSQDATYELAVGLKTLRHLPKLQVLKHPRNLGYGAALKTAIRHAKTPFVLTMDADGQHTSGHLSKAPGGTAGNLTSDAHLAALAIEREARIASCDQDFRRFPGLRHFDPLG